MMLYASSLTQKEKKKYNKRKQKSNQEKWIK